MKVAHGVHLHNSEWLKLKTFVLAPEDGILMDASDGMVGEVPRDVDLPPGVGGENVSKSFC